MYKGVSILPGKKWDNLQFFPVIPVISAISVTRAQVTKCKCVGYE